MGLGERTMIARRDGSEQGGAPTDPQGPTGRLARWLADFRIEDAPASARERAKALTLDGIGCAIFGAQLPWSRTAAQIVRQVEGDGSRMIIGWGLNTTAPGSVLLNGTFIQGFELDDFHLGGPLHSASLVLPALFAVAEGDCRISGWQFLEAAMAGYEVGPRVGMALHGAEMLRRGWHSGAVFGTHAAAAATGKLLGLSAERFEDALGLAATQSAGLMAAQYEAMSKRMHHGFAARNGFYAAMLAAGGFTGIKRVFERDYGGFLSTFGEGHDPDPAQITAGLGHRWEVEHIVIKEHATMGGIHAPLDALSDIRGRRRLKADEITRIEVEVSPAVYHHGWWPPERPLTPIGAQMNIGYAVSVAVLDGAAMVQQFSPARIDSDDIWALLPRIDVRSIESFETGNARVAVHFSDGECIEVTRCAPRSVENPQSLEAVAAKYRLLTRDLIEPARQAAIEEMVRDLEQVEEMRELFALLAPPVRAPFE